jgi:hypothetical protein
VGGKGRTKNRRDREKGRDGGQPRGQEVHGGKGLIFWGGGGGGRATATSSPHVALQRPTHRRRASAKPPPVLFGTGARNGGLNTPDRSRALAAPLTSSSSCGHFAVFAVPNPFYFRVIFRCLAPLQAKRPAPAVGF